MVAGGHEEEKKAGAAEPTATAHKGEPRVPKRGASRGGKETGPKSHRVSKEEGFTGEPDTWFDGKCITSNVYLLQTLLSRSS